MSPNLRKFITTLLQNCTGSASFKYLQSTNLCDSLYTTPDTRVILYICVFMPVLICKVIKTGKVWLYLHFVTGDVVRWPREINPNPNPKSEPQPGLTI